MAAGALGRPPPGARGCKRGRAAGGPGAPAARFCGGAGPPAQRPSSAMSGGLMALGWARRAAAAVTAAPRLRRRHAPPQAARAAVTPVTPAEPCAGRVRRRLRDEEPSGGEAPGEDGPRACGRLRARSKGRAARRRRLRRRGGGWGGARRRRRPAAPVRASAGGGAWAQQPAARGGRAGAVRTGPPGARAGCPRRVAPAALCFPGPPAPGCLRARRTRGAPAERGTTSRGVSTARLKERDKIQFYMLSMV